MSIARVQYVQYVQYFPGYVAIRDVSNLRTFGAIFLIFQMVIIIVRTLTANHVFV